MLLAGHHPLIPVRQCAVYLSTIQRTQWFQAAFTSHARPLSVIGGGGYSHAAGATRRLKIGAYDRADQRTCEVACLHELAHIVTNDHGAGHERREPSQGPNSTRGHHHAWRVNFVFLVRMTLGQPAAVRLRQEFRQWGLPTNR